MPDASRSGQGDRDDVLAGFLALADRWIARTADDRGIAWFRGAVDELSHASGDRALGIAIGLAPRRLGKAGLALGADDLARAAALRNGLDPAGWSVDQLARVALMVASYRDDAAFAASLDRFCATAEINELIALCLGFAIYPVTAPIEPRAREAIRSGMKPVFEALAHRNPYPAEVFAEDHWNQMIVKAVFTDSIAVADPAPGPARQPAARKHDGCTGAGALGRRSADQPGDLALRCAACRRGGTGSAGAGLGRRRRE